MSRNKQFDRVWKEQEKLGYRYGKDALEQVRFGFELAVADILNELELSGETIAVQVIRNQYIRYKG